MSSDLFENVYPEIVEAVRADTVSVIPRVNHGRWVVDCPSGDCRAGLLVTATDFVCDCTDQGVCRHGPSCGQMVAVVVPDDFAEIERLLLFRPALENRNWSFGESVDDLKRENLVHGVRL